MLQRILDFTSSLKLTIFCLAAALVLVFGGTIAQIHNSIDVVQAQYFRSMLVWWGPASASWKIPVFPGGHLIGAVLLANLITAHIRRFQWTWRKMGIQLTHAGLIIMLAGGLFTDLFSVESFMRLAPGDTKNYSEDSRSMELVVIDQTDRELDQVTAIPAGLLKPGATITHDSLPFRIVVQRFYLNGQIQMMGKVPGAQPAATQGIGSRVTITEAPENANSDMRDQMSAVIEIVPLDGGASTGTWLVSAALGAPQTFSCAGKQWRLAMRAVRHYKPYSLTLQKFTHETYMGTDIAKNFASRVTLIDPERSENRDVLIYMNHPLRYRGDTYYQASFERGDAATILQVVHNPTFVAPYVACVVVAIGLLIQFSYHLTGFARRMENKAANS
jgi:hypothetical protein